MMASAAANDLVEMVQSVAALDLGHDGGGVAEALDQRAQLVDVAGVLHERLGHEVDALRQSDTQVVAVLVGDRRAARLCTPGTVMPLCEARTPPTTTSQIDVTGGLCLTATSSMSPSPSRMRSPQWIACSTSGWGT